MAFDISSTFLNEDSSENGVWVDFYEGARLRIASTENPRYRAALAKRAKANKIKLDGEPNPDVIKLTTAITCQAMADHILLDWDGVEIDGAPLLYSKAAAYDILMKSPQLREFVSAQAGSDSNFQGITAPEVGKPSVGFSVGGVTAIS